MPLGVHVGLGVTGVVDQLVQFLCQALRQLLAADHDLAVVRDAEESRRGIQPLGLVPAGAQPEDRPLAVRRLRLGLAQRQPPRRARAFLGDEAEVAQHGIPRAAGQPAVLAVPHRQQDARPLAQPLRQRHVERIARPAVHRGLLAVDPERELQLGDLHVRVGQEGLQVLLRRFVEVVEVHVQRHRQQRVHVHAGGQRRLGRDPVGPIGHAADQFNVNAGQPPAKLDQQPLHGLAKMVDVGRVEVAVAGDADPERDALHARHSTSSRGEVRHPLPRPGEVPSGRC